jgi:hypothetical protein
MSQPIDEFGAIFCVQWSNFFRKKRRAGRKHLDARLTRRKAHR